MSLPRWILDIVSEEEKAAALMAYAAWERDKAIADRSYEEALDKAKQDHQRAMIKIRADWEAAKKKAREPVDAYQRKTVGGTG